MNEANGIITQKQYEWDTRLVSKYGLLTAGMLLLFYGLMWSLGLETMIMLRYGNLFIFGLGAFFGIRALHRKYSDQPLSYFSGLVNGTALNALASAVFSIVVYLSIIGLNPELGNAIIAQLPGSGSISLEAVIGLLALEGASLGLLASIVVMQYYK